MSAQLYFRIVQCGLLCFLAGLVLVGCARPPIVDVAREAVADDLRHVSGNCAVIEQFENAHASGSREQNVRTYIVRFDAKIRLTRDCYQPISPSAIVEPKAYWLIPWGDGNPIPNSTEAEIWPNGTAMIIEGEVSLVDDHGKWVVGQVFAHRMAPSTPPGGRRKI